MPNVFNARAAEILKADRFYRVYFVRDTFYFIVIGGADPVALGGAMFGLIGVLIAQLFKEKTKGKREEEWTALDRQDPEWLLSSNKNNFKVMSAEIKSGMLLKRSIWGQHGTEVGRCSLVWVNGKKLNLLFETLDDMHAAAGLLPAFLGSRLEVKVQWDPKKKRYIEVKK